MISLFHFIETLTNQTILYWTYKAITFKHQTSFYLGFIYNEVYSLGSHVCSRWWTVGPISMSHLSHAMRAWESNPVHPLCLAGWLRLLEGEHCLAASGLLLSQMQVNFVSNVCGLEVNQRETSGWKRMVGNQPAAVGRKTTPSRRSALDSVGPGQACSVPGRLSSGMEAGHPPPEEQVLLLIT